MREITCDLSISSRTGHDAWVAFSHYFRRGDTYTIVNFYGEEDEVPLTFEMWEYTREEFEHSVWQRLYYLLEDLGVPGRPEKAKLVITLSGEGMTGCIYQEDNTLSWPGDCSFIEVTLRKRDILEGLPELKAFITDMVTKEHLEIDLAELHSHLGWLQTKSGDGVPTIENRFTPT